MIAASKAATISAAHALLESSLDDEESLKRIVESAQGAFVESYDVLLEKAETPSKSDKGKQNV